MWPPNNRESWAHLRQTLDWLADGAGWTEWLALAKPIVAGLERAGLSDAFRAGSSMDLLIFSTLDHHDLGDSLRVEVRPEPAFHSVRIAMGKQCLHYDPPDLEQVVVPFSDCLPVIMDHLRRLWVATKPHAPFPSADTG